MSNNEEVMPSNFLNVEVLAESIPKRSGLRRQTKEIQEKVINDILGDKRVAVILRELKESGVKGVTDQQLRRVKRAIIPVWNFHTEPRMLFTKNLQDTLLKMEYMIDLQYKRIIEASEEELEKKEILTPSKYIDPEQIPGLKKLLKEYYDDSISEVDRNVLLSMTEKKERNEFLFKEVQAFWALLEKYLTMRRDLGDQSIRLKEESNDERAIELYGSEKEKQDIQDRVGKVAAKLLGKKVRKN